MEQRTFTRKFELDAVKLNNLVDAIARGENMEPLLARLRLEECRKKELVVGLDSLTKPAKIVDLDKARLKRNLLDRIANATQPRQGRFSGSCSNHRYFAS